MRRAAFGCIDAKNFNLNILRGLLLVALSSTIFYAKCINSNIKHTLFVKVHSTIIGVIFVNLKDNCVLNKSCNFFLDKIVKQLALFSEILHS